MNCSMNTSTAVMKKLCDISIAICGIAILMPLFPLIALAIKLSSKGPVIFKQMRIGLATPERTKLFYMYKFRTMAYDAEAKSGAVWASKNDPRITPIGRFLRKTRLDELPQLYNVLIGDMSIIGPRPERPGFYKKLEKAIPYFAERTYGVLPGITGLAQINQGYDTCLDDVRSKVAYDHCYALALHKPSSWIKMDLWIALHTIKVMVLGRGQ